MHQNRPKVTIDWSQVSDNTNTDSLMEWVSAVPETRNVHVYLSPAVRGVRHTLLSLGCKVTLRPVSA